MTDMTAAIQPKADELAADHLLSGPMTITITSVEVKPGTERPVTIWYENDGGLPFRPCKSVSRIFVAAWGPDASKYAGKRATLYRDSSVKWGGMEVGGIRISHMSDIARDLVLALTATKGKKALTTVKPMPAAPVVAPAKPRQTAEEWAATHIAEVGQAQDADALDALQKGAEKAMAKLITSKPELHANVMNAYDRRIAELTPAPQADDGEAGE